MSKQKRNVTSTVRARLRHAEENTSDYLEAIAELKEETGQARVVDLATRLGVSKATVTKKVAQLQKDGLVKTEPYKAIFLEEAGAAIAAESKRIHKIVLDFLLAAGVSPDIAEEDAEGIEHHVSSETLAALEQLTRSIQSRKL